jgi:hypothetical protein
LGSHANDTAGDINQLNPSGRRTCREPMRRAPSTATNGVAVQQQLDKSFQQGCRFAGRPDLPVRLLTPRPSRRFLGSVPRPSATAGASSAGGLDRRIRNPPIRRWIRDGRFAARSEGRPWSIDPAGLEIVRNELYPMLPMPREWEHLEVGSPAPNWVAAVALSRNGR